MSKSKEEYIQRLRKGKADSEIVYSEQEIENRVETAEKEFNKVYDSIMEKYIEELRRRVYEH